MGLKILVNNYNSVWVYKEQVDALGLLPGKDYVWRYTPAVNDWLSAPITPATVEFDFKDKQWETYFKLRWIEA
jgi:hypothetical protein